MSTQTELPQAFQDCVLIHSVNAFIIYVKNTLFNRYRLSCLQLFAIVNNAKSDIILCIFLYPEWLCL